MFYKTMKGMTKTMYDVPKSYVNPYYFNANMPAYYSEYVPRDLHESHQQVFDAILNGVKREATAIDLYTRLYRVAPNQKHKYDIFYALENRKANLSYFTNLYFSCTGMQPTYQVDKVSFRNYKEGLQKAHEVGAETYEEYQKNSLLTDHPQIQQVFLHASSGERENASRFASLYNETLKDRGSESFVVDISNVTKQNNTFRTALWTGKHLQLTLMSIDVGEDIGLESHPNLDQFIRIEEGEGLVQMGDNKSNFDFEERATSGYAIFIPAGRWHNLTNTGNKPIKLYSIYAPPEHPFGTVHETKEDAMAAEENNH